MAQARVTVSTKIHSVARKMQVGVSMPIFWLARPCAELVADNVELMARGYPWCSGRTGYWLLLTGRPSARNGRSSQIIAELEGGSTLASACRAARSSPQRGLADASKPRFERRPTSAVHQVPREILGVGCPDMTPIRLATDSSRPSRALRGAFRQSAPKSGHPARHPGNALQPSCAGTA